MSDSFMRLEPDSSGKKVQMFENAISGNTVEAMAVSLVDSTGLSDSFVQVLDGMTGKKIQYFENAISGNTVEAIAVVLVDSSGVAI